MLYRIASTSLGGEWLARFHRNESAASMSAAVRRMSVLMFTHEAVDIWQHVAPAKKPGNGEVVNIGSYMNYVPLL